MPFFSYKGQESKAGSTLNFRLPTSSTRTHFWWKFTVCPLKKHWCMTIQQDLEPANPTSCNSLPSTPSTNLRHMNSTWRPHHGREEHCQRQVIVSHTFPCQWIKTFWQPPKISVTLILPLNTFLSNYMRSHAINQTQSTSHGTTFYCPLILNLIPPVRLFTQIIRNFQTCSLYSWKTYSPPNVSALDVSAAFFKISLY